MVPELPEAEPRLQRRYQQLVVAHLSESQRIAAGLHPPPMRGDSFAAVQAAWRFYSNPRISLPRLAQPLVECARLGVWAACEDWVLVVHDWSNLRFNQHAGKKDRVELSNKNDLGYDLLTALVVSDRDGSPLAPVDLELKAADGIHSTRASAVLSPLSQLDWLTEVVRHVEGMGLGRKLVHALDREADSVGLYRQWDASGWHFLIRADDNRIVLHNGQETHLGQLAATLQGKMPRAGRVKLHGQDVWHWIGEAPVVLHRRAMQHRVRDGKAQHVLIPGVPLTLRLAVSELRDENEQVLTRWLLLTNLPQSVTAATVALWYLWRWKIESYHKLLKGAGQQVESWQQETAEALARRLTVVAMSAVVVWHLARDPRPEADEFRQVLVRLSGRQMKRGRNRRNFTEPALLVGLGVLVPMLALLEHYDLKKLRQVAQEALPDLFPLPLRRESG
jgi:hypothetical protein